MCGRTPNVGGVLGLCEKWEVGGAPIGTVTDTGQMRVFKAGELVGAMPVRALVDDCPLYDLEPVKPEGMPYPAPKALLSKDLTAAEILLALLSSANIASRRALFEQYDSIVQSRTVRRPEQADAAVLSDRAAHGEGVRRRPTRHGPFILGGEASRCRGSRSRSTATAGASRPILIRARSRRCSSALRTLPAWARSRWGRPTTSTSATRRSRTSPGS